MKTPPSRPPSGSLAGLTAYPTLTDALGRFLGEIEGHAKTRAAYGHSLHLFLLFLRERDGLDPNTATTDQIAGDDTLARFYGWLRGRGRGADGTDYAPRSLALYTAAVSALCTDLYLHNALPAIDLVRLRTLLRRRLADAGAPPEVDPSTAIPALVAHAEARCTDSAGGPGRTSASNKLIMLRDRALVHLLDATGVRVSEALALRRAQVAHGQDEARLVGKGGRPRTIYFPASLRAAMAAYLAVRRDDNPYLYVSHGRVPARHREGARPRHAALTPVHAWRIVNGLALECGAPEIHPHMFRHYRASRWLTDGLPLEMVQELLGHASITMTRAVYARYLGSAVRDAFFAQAKRAERVEARHLDNLDNPDTMRYDRDNDAPRDHAGAGGGRDEQG